MVENGISQTRDLTYLLMHLYREYKIWSQKEDAHERFMGICYVISRMLDNGKISNQEFIKLNYYITKERPTEEYNKFFYEHAYKNSYHPYFFKYGNYQIRLKFILYLIYKEEINSMIEVLEENPNQKGYGLCALSFITHCYIQWQKPTLFRNVKFYRIRPRDLYWWREDNTKIRVRFLKHLLKGLEKGVYENYDRLVEMHTAW